MVEDVASRIPLSPSSVFSVPSILTPRIRNNTRTRINSDSVKISSSPLSSLGPSSRSSDLTPIPHSSSSSSSGVSSSGSPTPAPRVVRSSHRLRQQPPSLTASDHETFITAHRSLPRSVRFSRNMATPSVYSDPPEVALEYRSAHTDPAVVGASTKPAPSQAGSVRSTLSSYLDREREMEELEKKELARMKAESEAGAQASAPVVAGDEGDLEVLKRQQEEAVATAQLLQRIIDVKQSIRSRPTPLPNPPPTPVVLSTPVQADPHLEPSSPGEYPLLVQPSYSPEPEIAGFVDISLKKVSAPKAWQGDFNYRRREAFVKSASGYLASVGVALNKKISSSLTPQAHLALRSLFSSESKGSFLSAVDWFDTIDRDNLFVTPQLIFAELRAHWVDDAAAEDNFRRYLVSDEDKASTFREGLNSGAKDFLLQVQAAQSAAFGTPARMGFKKVVQVASAYDSLESRRSQPLSSSTSSTRASRSSTNASASASPTPSSSSSPTSSSGSSSSAPRKSWAEAAQDWQGTHAVKDCERWFRKDTRPTSSLLETGDSRTRKKKSKKKRAAVKLSLPPEPEVATSPLTLPVVVGGQDATALVDSGSQADVLSSAFAHKLGLPFRRLLAPVHADLGADGHSVRLSIYAEVTVQVGKLTIPCRSFFVAPLPSGIDAILGVPWLHSTNTAVSSTSLFFVPTGPSEEVYNPREGRFNFQPRRNFDDLGFVNRSMTEDEEHRFAVCAMLAGVEGIDDYVDFESHNPLLDVDDDDPSLPDISAEESEHALSALKERFADVLVDSLPTRLPPHRPVDHDIDLLDKELKIRPRVIGIPARYDKQWRAHVLKFKETGYWSPLALDSACSMFSVPKHESSEARSVINLKPRNANTRKRISPIPDMKGVRSRLGAHRYRTKLDFKNAYEQIRLALESVAKSGFVTPSGTFVSRVMQQGDTNAADTMHRVCAMMFEKALGRFLDVFYDDVFIYSHTCRAHLRYLEIVLTTLRHYRFFLSRTKVEMMAPSLKALGCIIDDDGVSVDPSQWDSVKNWPVPKNKKDIMRFAGTVQWMGDHLPHLNELMAPISRLTGSVDWNWSPACQAAFELVKSLVPRTLSPLNLAALDSGEEKLFIFSDASILGCGSWIGQGVTRETAHPYRYHSAKFNAAQRNYHTADQELLGVLDACLKYRELILGWDVVVVTDHQPLKTYWEQTPKLTRRHVRLWETLSQFSLLWDFIPGKLNVFADSLSRLAELCAEEEWLTLPDAQEPPPSSDDDHPFPDEPSAKMILAVLSLQSGTGRTSDVVVAPLCALHSGAPVPTISPLLAPDGLSSQNLGEVLTVFPSEFIAALPAAVKEDVLGRKIIAAPDQFPPFALANDLLFRTDGETPQLYVPQGVVSSGAGAPSFVELVIKQAHDALGHFGAVKTLSVVRRGFWWASMHKDVHDYVRSCEPCARSKSTTSKPYGLLHPLAVPSRPWATAGMDFVVGLPPVLWNGEVVDFILSVTDFLSRAMVLIPLPSTASARDVATRYYNCVFRRSGVQESLVSDRDPKFTSDFWRSLHKQIGTDLRFSSSAHPQTDGRSEVTNKVVGQVLRSLCEDDHESWAHKVALVEFAINSTPSASTTLPPFAVLYGFLPSSWPSTPWSSPNVDVDRRGEQARLDWLRCSDALIALRVDMVHYATRRRREDLPQFQVGHKVFVSTAGLRFPHHLSGKFIPKFIGPYDIIASNPAKSTFDIAFPSHLSVHPRIHSSKLRPFFPNDDLRFPSRSFTSPSPAVVAADGAEEFLVEKLVGDRLRYGSREFRVRYLGYSASADKWRPEAELKETAPDMLRDYLALVDARRAHKPLLSLDETEY
ncbi:hypothetical protein JCM11641_001779 [Rhodosporidiobolus odoratus]